MRALTVKQPWASLIASGLKTIENRTYPVPKTVRGQVVAIHAGKGFDPHGLERHLFNACNCGSPIYECLACELFQALDPHKQDSKRVAGRVLATARIAGQFEPESHWPKYFVPMLCFQCEGSGLQQAWNGSGVNVDVCDYCEKGQGRPEDETFREFNAYGWILDEVTLVQDPTVYRGALGFWTLPDIFGIKADWDCSGLLLTYGRLQSRYRLRKMDRSKREHPTPTRHCVQRVWRSHGWKAGDPPEDIYPTQEDRDRWDQMNARAELEFIDRYGEEL